MSVIRILDRDGDHITLEDDDGSTDKWSSVDECMEGMRKHTGSRNYMPWRIVDNKGDRVLRHVTGFRTMIMFEDPEDTD